MADIEKFIYYSSGSKKVLKPTDRIVVGSGGLAFEGATANDFETQIAVVDPTADRTVTFPDASGNILLDSQNIDVGDNVYLKLGDSDDLEIVHNGSNNVIKGTGGINVQTGDFQIVKLDGSSTIARFQAVAGIELYHNASKKLETISTGVQTTGTININGAYTLPTSDGSANQVLTTDGSGSVTFQNAASGGTALDDVSIGDAESTLATSAGNIIIDAQGQDTDILFKGNDGGSTITALTIDMSDKGTLIANHDLKLQSDASKILFGADGDVYFEHTADQGLVLNMDSAGSGEPRLDIKSNSTSSGAKLRFFHQTSSPFTSDRVGEISYTGKQSAGGFHEYGSFRLVSSNVTDGSESGRFDFYVASAGNAPGIGNTLAMTMGGDSSGNISIDSYGALGFKVISSDPSTVSDFGHIYTKDVSSSAEVFVQDEAGNVTQISPHNEEGDWVYWSENIKTGKKVKVNMEKMIKRLEEITGETFFEEYIPGE